MQTNVPPDQLQTLLDLSQKVQDNKIQSFVLGPPYAQRIPNSGAYLLGLDDARIRRLSVSLFGTDSRFATAEGG